VKSYSPRLMSLLAGGFTKLQFSDFSTPANFPGSSSHTAKSEQLFVSDLQPLKHGKRSEKKNEQTGRGDVC
jgi:hypothetical protein